MDKDMDFDRELEAQAARYDELTATAVETIKQALENIK